MNTYPSIEAFYSENEARRRSPEADYGVWWHDGVGSEFWRVSYIQVTGEVYAVNHQRDQVEVLGVVPPDQEDPLVPGRRVWGRTYYQTLDRILDGWSEHCGQLNSLAWVREKLAQKGAK